MAKSGPSVPPESFYCVFEFMSCEEGLGLRGVELTVYALVYSYSQGRGGCYYGSNAMTAHRAGCSERHAIDVVHSLERRGLIRNVGQRCWRGRSTNMYVAERGPVAEAMARCAAATPEATSPGPGSPPEVSSPRPVNPPQGSPEVGPPNSKGLPDAYQREGAGRGSPAGVDAAFREVLRGYPYTRDEAAARALYEPLYREGVRAEHVASTLEAWARDHPARDGRRQFYPELASFLDPNNPEGYRAMERRAGEESARQRRLRARRLTEGCARDEMYERYTLDGLDERASSLYRAHLESGGALRGEPWDAWFQYMTRARDVEAREHWIEVRGGREGPA